MIPINSRILLALASAALLGGCAAGDMRMEGVRPAAAPKPPHGPDVSIRAMFMIKPVPHQIQPTISVSDSAYVVVGDLGDDGSLRILYPSQPGGDNRIGPGTKLLVDPFTPRVSIPLAGTVRVRMNDIGWTGSGNVFVIASNKPLDLTKLVEDGKWSTFDVYYTDFETNPMPAIRDLAQAVSPDIREVSMNYAAYFGTQFSRRMMNNVADLSKSTGSRPGRPPR